MGKSEAALRPPTGMRGAARSLVEVRGERFESRHGLEDSRARYERAVQASRPAGTVVLRPEWQEEQGHAVLQLGLAPPPATLRLLKALSIGMALLVASSIAVIVLPQVTGAVTFLLPLLTGLAVLGFPMLALALSSNREAEEARLRKALRVELQDAEARLPPQQKWKDED
jgi:hypothetical protein